MGDGASLERAMTQVAYLMHTEGDIAAEAQRRPQPAMTGERKLRESMLKRAVLDMGMAHEGYYGKRLANEAEVWVHDDSSDWALSFVRVCEDLGIEPEYVRAQIRALVAPCQEMRQRVRFKRTLG